MKKSSILLNTIILLFSHDGLAWQGDDSQHLTSVEITLSSDYMWRGYSQSNNKPAISASVDYADRSGFYGGIWASNVDVMNDDDRVYLELDIYAGFEGEFGESDINYNVGVLRYIYPGTHNIDWNEVYGSLGYHYFTVGIAYSGDVDGTSEKGRYYNLGVDYPLFAGIDLNLGLGYYDFNRKVFNSNNSDSATDYRIGLSKDFAGFEFSLSYTDTDNNAKNLYGSKYADGRFIFSLSKSLY